MKIQLTPRDLYTIGYDRYWKPREWKAMLVLFIGLLIAVAIAFVPAIIDNNTNNKNVEAYYQPDNPNAVVMIEPHNGYVIINNQVYVLRKDGQADNLTSGYTILAAIVFLAGFGYCAYIYNKAEDSGKKFRDENITVNQ